jgi:SET domain-containing protein
LCSYVFDGKPPDMKKQELAKRHDIFEYFFHPLIIPTLFDTHIISVLQSLRSLLECTIIFRYSKRDDATKDLTEAVEVFAFLQVWSLVS